MPEDITKETVQEFGSFEVAVNNAALTPDNGEHNIRVNSVAPGAIDTPMLGMLAEAKRQ